MVFSSAIFLFYFLPIVLCCYYLAKRHLVIQNFILFVSSIIFYFWGEKQYTILVLASVFFNFIMGIAIDEQKRPSLKKAMLFFAVGANLCVLFYFKYFGFFIQNLIQFTGDQKLSALSSGIHLPLGISFFTFHGLTYVIDIYRGDAHVSRNPLTVGLYTLFFPQLVAGPIVRYKDIDTQLTHRTYTSERFYTGVKRFIIGFAKKLLIANTMGEVADQIYGIDPNTMSAKLLWLAAGCYALQIYFDFSGYSDMAIGLAKMFGFDFLENFNFPYSATSIKDFWRRWHISLSNFFRDYVYIPLGGNRKNGFRTYLNLFTVFLLTGIWHGASWNFVIWGLYHGFFMIIERLGFDKVIARLPKLLQHGYAILVVLVGWVFFRIEDFHLLKHVLGTMCFRPRSYMPVYSLLYFMTPYRMFIMALGMVFSFPVHQYFNRKITFNSGNIFFRTTSDLCYLALFVVSLSVMASTTFNPFIYFRF